MSGAPPTADAGKTRLDNLALAGLIDQRVYTAKVLAVKVNLALQQSQLILQLGNTKISLPTQLPVKAGDVLQVRFLAPDTVTLLSAPPQPTASDQPRQINNHLVSIIGRQWPLNQLLSLLASQALSSSSDPLLSHADQRLAQQLHTGLQRLFEQLIPARLFAPQARPPALAPTGTPAVPELAPTPESQKQLQAQAVQTLIKNSGLFTEATLAQLARATANEAQSAKMPSPAMLQALAKGQIPDQSGQPATTAAQILPEDLKTQLLRVELLLKTLARATHSPVTTDPHLNLGAAATQLNPLHFPFVAPSGPMPAKAPEYSTGELLKLVALTLQRIQFHQLSSLLQSQSPQGDTPQLTTWVMEIPLFVSHNHWIDNIQLRLEREKQRESDEKDDQEPGKDTRWRITLAFNFETTGPFYVQASLTQHQVTPTLWAEKPETVKLMDREIPHFRDQLLALGLTVGDICCRQGQPQQTKTKLERQLVDIKA